MLHIRANHPHDAFSADNLAILTNPSNAAANFHDTIPSRYLPSQKGRTEHYTFSSTTLQPPPTSNILLLLTPSPGTPGEGRGEGPTAKTNPTPLAAPLTPSPGTPGEGWGEGPIGFANHTVSRWQFREPTSQLPSPSPSSKQPTTQSAGGLPSVNTSAPVAVTATVCSKCAAGFPSSVTTVH